MYLFFFLFLFLAGNPNEQSFQLYKTEIYYDQLKRRENAGRQNEYNPQAVSGPEMMNNYQGNGFRHEEAMFNPTGPCQGGSVLMHIFQYVYFTVKALLEPTLISDQL